MTLYTPVWTDVPRSQYEALSEAARRAFDEKFELVLNDPRGVGDYDKLADQWTTDFDSGAGFLVYIINDQTVRVVVLRVYST
ncbi:MULTISPECIES: hypothetical protein [Mycolicibacter]|uniref:Type II toxin-antitoxin system RelE/ParE family toxin n=2 Tax=Mycolicibacter TaxID=1073531 RepID=A0ABU5XNJ7_9MYCO|nr:MULTISPECIES: hypothetical protein [unclassified Mycolicibacter]MEB3023337.1 hypothetical protein [Mycolicibacter sp. MYC098]MEB3035127.1 hypothetical protein [Mycolicibacter sp. MYC340]